MKEAVKDANTNAAAALIAGEDLAELRNELSSVVHREGEGVPYRIRRDGTVEWLEDELERPVFRRGAVELYTADSFAAYVNRFKNETTLVFADVVKRAFTGILDYHDPGPFGRAVWDLLRATLQLRHTPNWVIWTSQNKQAMTQAAFAQFLEDNLPDIAQPDGATIVEIARTLEAKTEVQFESHLRADNGAHSFKYVEDINSQAGRGTLTVPQEFTLVLHPFEGSDPYQVQARFRYRINTGKLTLWYDLIRIEDLLRTAFAREMEKIDDALTETVPKVPLLAGPAPAPQKND